MRDRPVRRHSLQSTMPTLEANLRQRPPTTHNALLCTRITPTAWPPRSAGMVAIWHVQFESSRYLLKISNRLKWSARYVHVKPALEDVTSQFALTPLQPVQDRLRLVDLVLEVRDARIPFSSSNPELSKLVQHKRRLVILNKADLAASDKQQVALYLSAVTHLHHALCRCSYSFV